LETLLDRSGEPGARYRVVGVLSTDPDSEGHAAARGRGVPVRVNDFEAFTEERNGGRADLEDRAAYDRRTLAMLEPLGPRILVLCGYLLIVTRPILSAFPGLILNVHDADLRLRAPSGGPRYPGLRATLDALRAGEVETRSTVHVVTADVDAGPPLAVSRAYPVPPVVERAREWGDERILKACAYAHREWMMRDSWGSLLDGGLETLVAWMRCRQQAEREAAGPAVAAGRTR
jgi:folate-dependent phosphoribosylglycinamide formyltransferase PurN